MRSLRLSILMFFVFPLVGINSRAFAQLLTHSFVTVGDTYNLSYLNGFGEVNYTYGISKFETTISQYTTFLNAVAREGDTYNLYQSSMGSQNCPAGGQATNAHGGVFVIPPPDGQKQLEQDMIVCENIFIHRATNCVCHTL